MAEEPNPQPQVEEREVVAEQTEPTARRGPNPKLRYLDFVQVAAAQAAVCLAGLYGLAKDHAGPLRTGVDAVESAVKGVVGPVYVRFHAVPLDVLAFVDRKVDDTVHEVDKHLPGALKAASAQALAVARELAAEAQKSGAGPVRAVRARGGAPGRLHLAFAQRPARVPARRQHRRAHRRLLGRQVQQGDGRLTLLQY